MSFRPAAVLMFALFAAGCVGGGSGVDQVEIQATGKALAGGIALTSASIGLPPNGDPQLHLAVALDIKGKWTESGGPLCQDSDPIGISNSVSLTIDDLGNYQASGVIPLRAGGSGGDVPGGCKARTGIDIEKFQGVTLEARVPTIKWNDYQVWMDCQTQATLGCNGSTDLNCVDTQTRVCRDTAWDQTLWHRVTGARCIDSGSYYCLSDPDHPGSPGDSVTAKLVLSDAAVQAINGAYGTAGALVISGDLNFQFNN